MNGSEHYQAAERLIATADEVDPFPSEEYAQLMAGPRHTPPSPAWRRPCSRSSAWLPVLTRPGAGPSASPTRESPRWSRPRRALGRGLSDDHHDHGTRDAEQRDGGTLMPGGQEPEWPTRRVEWPGEPVGRPPPLPHPVQPPPVRAPRTTGRRQPPRKRKRYRRRRRRYHGPRPYARLGCFGPSIGCSGCLLVVLAVLAVLILAVIGLA
jgi:hypothetical protein